jgi:flagellin
VQTAEGALTEVHSMLNRMFELAEQSANGTYDANLDRQQLQKEVGALRTEINRIRDSSNFNGQKLFDGSLDGANIKSDGVGVTGVTTTINNANKKDELAKALTGSVLKLTTTKDSDGKITGDTVTTALSDLGKQLSITGYSLGDVTATVTDGKGDITFAINDSDGAVATFKVSIDKAKAGTAEIELGVGTNMKLQIGDTSDSYNQMEVNVADIHADMLGIGSIDISTVGGASSAMASIKTAINSVSDIRGGLGAIQNRLEHTINNLSVMQENMQDAESTIRDTDVAAEMMKYTKNSILVQSAQAMLAQANQQPQGVLQLLQ